MSSHPLYWEHHTHTLYDITLGIGIASFALYKTLHPHFMKSKHHFLTSHPLYLTSYQRYFCHHMNSIDDITPTLFMRSHPVYMSTSYPLHTKTYSLYFYHHSHCTCVSHTHTFHDITLFVYMTLHTLYVEHQILYIRYHIHSLWHHATLFMTSHALYSCHHSHDT